MAADSKASVSQHQPNTAASVIGFGDTRILHRPPSIGTTVNAEICVVCGDKASGKQF